MEREVRGRWGGEGGEGGKGRGGVGRGREGRHVCGHYSTCTHRMDR